MYRNIMIRSKVTELRSVAYGAKLSIDEFVQRNGHLPTSVSQVNLGTLGEAKYLEDMTWEADVLTVIGDPDSMGLPIGEELSLIYRPIVNKGVVDWECETIGPQKYAPPSCPTM